VLGIGRQANLHVTCLRLPLVYESGNKGNLFRMIAAIDRGVFPPLQEVGNRRSLVHVADVVQTAVFAAGTPAANGQCYIVTDGRSYSPHGLYVLILLRWLGKRMSSWPFPLWVLKALAVAGDVMRTTRLLSNDINCSSGCTRASSNGGNIETICLWCWLLRQS